MDVSAIIWANVWLNVNDVSNIFFTHCLPPRSTRSLVTFHYKEPFQKSNISDRDIKVLRWLHT